MNTPRKPRTPEQKAVEAAKMRARRAAMTPEQLKAQRAKDRACDRRRYANLTPEQRTLKRQKRKPPTEEQLEQKRQRSREHHDRRMRSETEEQRAVRLEHTRNRMREIRSQWTPEQHEFARKRHRDREKQRRAARTPEQRAMYTLRGSAKRLGFDPDLIEAHFTAHSGLCDICGRSATELGWRYRRLSIDHDHETGAFRGLLCDACNHGIGQLGDDPERLYAAAEYLLKARAAAGSAGVFR